jgi:ABC-type branched-subunit amino acid transport system ATPase component/predicted MFS family arabinose efflux permease
VIDAIKRFFHDMRPSVATAGNPIMPVGIIFLLNAADELDRVAFGVLVPEIRDYYGVSLTSVLTVVSLSSILVLLLAVPVGYAADRWSRTKLLAAGATTWGVFSLLTAFARSLGMLGVFRFGSGMGKTLDPAQQSLLADYYPPHARGGVFSFHQLGNSVGQFFGPLLAGWLATLFFWQAPFLVFGLIGFVGAVLVLVKLREPERGAQERIIAGTTEAPREPPPSWSEAWRIARSVGTLRRIWYALPFLVGAYFGTAALLGVFLEEQFDLSAAARGTIQAVGEPFQIAGLIVGGAIANRLLSRGRPGRLVSYAGLMGMLGGLSFVVIAFVPLLPVVVVLMCAFSFTASIFVPATTVLSTLVIPPKARGFALGLAAVFIVPGVLLVPVAGMIGDAYGARMGVLILAPVYLIGAAILVGAGQTVEGDMRAAFASAAAATAAASVGADGSRSLLVVRDLDVHYGQVQILFGVDFDVAEGEIVALLGTNGAGKSTLLNAIGGLAPITNGAVNFGGDDITHLPPSEHAPRGIVPVPGGKGVFPSLTVAENLRLAAWVYADDGEYVRTATEQVLTFFPRLRERLAEPAGNLSGGEQQMLVLGQAFLSKPKLLMIDELSLGLAPAVVEQLLEIVRAIHAGGTTIILVEQSVNVALTVADRAVFMEKGEVRFTGPTADLLGRPDILRSVFLAGSSSAKGTIAATPRRWDPLAPEEPGVALEVRDLHRSYGGIVAVDGPSFTLEEGKVLGLIGPNGAGKTTIFDLISGFVEPNAGSVLLFGEDVTSLGPDQRALRGLQRSFQDAKLFPALTVEENILVALDRHLESRSPVLAGLHVPTVRKAEKKLERRADRLVQLLNLGDFRGKFVRELSTGSRRLVDIACVLASDPKVLLLDEPSSGVAQRETEELGPLLLRVKHETGCSVLIIEHDMALVSSVADELLALDLGRVVTRGTPAEVLEHPDVVQSYLGTDQAAISRSGRS